MNYVNLHSILASDYKKHNNRKFTFIPRLYRWSELLDFLIVGSKLYKTNTTTVDFTNSFKLSQVDKTSLHDYLKSLIGDKYLQSELYCYTSDDPSEPLAYAHLSNQYGRIWDSTELFDHPNQIVANSLEIAADKGDGLTTYYSTHYHKVYFYDLSDDYNGQGIIPPIYYYTGEIIDDFVNRSSNSRKIYINTRKLEGNIGIPILTTPNFISLEVEEIKSQQIEYFIERVFEYFKNRLEHIDNEAYNIQLKTEGIADKFSFAQVQKLLEEYKDLGIHAEKITDGYRFYYGT